MKFGLGPALTVTRVSVLWIPWAGRGYNRRWACFDERLELDHAATSLHGAGLPVGELVFCCP